MFSFILYKTINLSCLTCLNQKWKTYFIFWSSESYLWFLLPVHVVQTHSQFNATIYLSDWVLLKLQCHSALILSHCQITWFVVKCLVWSCFYESWFSFWRNHDCWSEDVQDKWWKTALNSSFKDQCLYSCFFFNLCSNHSI